jgi:glycosyltransferase involved in cell wall biosynthesis
MSQAVEAPRETLAIVGGFKKLRDSQPHGTGHAAYQMSHALAAHGGYRALHIYHDEPREALSLPSYPPIQLFQKPELRKSRVPYQAIYVANGVQRTSAPHVLRPVDWAPVVCTVGTTHHDGQWLHLLLALTSRAVRPTDGLVFKSHAARVLFQEVWNEWATRLPVMLFSLATTVIPNGVDVEVNRRSPAARAAMRARLRLRPDDLVFLAFSRLSPATKGDQQALIVRWRDVLARVPRAVLVLAGAIVDRPFAVELRQLARAAGVADQVIVLGDPYDLANDARLQLMSAADVFVHVSTGVEEASPLVVHEAMAHELPVIAASWAGVREVVVPGETGFLVQTQHAPMSPYLKETLFGQSDLLHNMAASRLVALDYSGFVSGAAALGDQELRVRMGASSRQHAEANDLVAAVRAHSEFFERVGRAAARAWPAHAGEAFRPLVDLQRVLAAQSGGALESGLAVRLADPARATLLLAGLGAESPARVAAALDAFAGHRTRRLADLAKAIASAKPEPDVSLDDPARVFSGGARLLVRMLNYGVIEPA